MYKVKFSESAFKFYNSTNENLTKKINKCVHNLEFNPYISNNIKRLSGTFHEYFCYRLGDYRLIYKIDEKEKQVVIRLIEHRSRVYKSH